MKELKIIKKGLPFMCLLTTVLLIVLSSVASADWWTMLLDTAEDLPAYYPRAVATDNAGRPHIVYGYNFGNYYHDYFDGSNWQHESIGTYCQNGAAVAFDSNTKIHIGCNDLHFSNGGINYYTNASGSWVMQTVDSVPDAGNSSAVTIAVDSNGKAHICRYYRYTRSLKYYTNASGSWVTEVIDGGEDFSVASIAADSNGKAHACYFNSQGDLIYATNATGPWLGQIIDSNVEYSSIAVDSNDKVHISYRYYNGFNYVHKYATNASGTWVIQTIGPVILRSMALDSNSNAHMIGIAGDIYPIYCTNASGSWVIQTLDTLDRVFWDAYTGVSVAVDSNNKVHFSYCNYQGHLTYATNGTVPFSALFLLTPNGGEAIPSGSTHTIRWGAQPEAVRFDIGYSLDNGATGTWKLIASGITNNSYDWTVPTFDRNKNRCRVGVRGYDASGTVIGTDISDNPFTIEVVKVTSPNASGLIMLSGYTHRITWQTNATIRPVGNVVVYGSPNEGLPGTWRSLALIEGNPGYYDWIVPTVGTIKDKCRIGIVLYDSTATNIGQDMSDYNFRIVPWP